MPSCLSFVTATLYLLLWACTTWAQPNTSAIARLNQYRADLGLSQVVPNSLLDQTALAHSQYLSALPDKSILSRLAPDGTPEMHLEHAGNTRFTGTTLTDRAKHQGYRYGAGEHVVFNERYNNGAAVVDQLMTTVYHRSGLLNPAWSELGAATDTSYSVLVLGEGPMRSKTASNWLASYPPHQGYAQRIGFQNELPDPAPERTGQWLGLPISVHAMSGTRLQVQSFAVEKLPNYPQLTKENVAGKILDRTTDRLVANNEAFFLPLFPLSYSSTYGVNVQLLVNQVPRTLQWTFQTPPNPFKVLPAVNSTEVIPGEKQLLEVQDVQGNWGWQLNIQSKLGVNIDTQNLGNGRLQINFPNNCDETCRLLVTVKHEGPHPSTEIREFVVSKAWLASKSGRPINYPKELLAAADSIRKQSGSKALAYAESSGRWVWSTGTGSGNQEEINKTVLANCVTQAEQMGVRKCELFPFNR